MQMPQMLLTAGIAGHAVAGILDQMITEGGPTVVGDESEPRDSDVVGIPCKNTTVTFAGLPDSTKSQRTVSLSPGAATNRCTPAAAAQSSSSPSSFGTGPGLGELGQHGVDVGGDFEALVVCHPLGRLGIGQHGIAFPPVDYPLRPVFVSRGRIRRSCDVMTSRSKWPRSRPLSGLAAGSDQ